MTEAKRVAEQRAAEELEQQEVERFLTCTASGLGHRKRCEHGFQYMSPTVSPVRPGTNTAAKAKEGD